MHAIETFDLTKRYGELTAVDHLNLKVEKGEIFGFLGHNGSGKTTTIMMLCGLVEAMEGSAKVAGFDVQREILEVKKRIGFLPENTSYYDNLTARQNLEFFGELAGLNKKQREERADELLETVGLKSWKDVKVGKFSKGMQQRLGIAQALVRDPEVVFLDEPSSGLDPQGMKEVRELILRLGREGKTVFLSSHLLFEVKQVCSIVGVLKHGKLIALDTIDNLARKLNSDATIKIELEVTNPEIGKELGKNSKVMDIASNGNKFMIHAQEDIRREIFDIIRDSDAEILTLKLTEPNLEDILLKVYETGE